MDIQGVYLGVLYHTHNGGTQLALGRTENQLTTVWRTVVENLGRREIDRHTSYRLTFEDPAPDLLSKLDEKRVAECLDAYKANLARAACATSPPPGMRFCLDSEYLSDLPLRGPGYNPKYPPPITEEHSWCRRCAYGLLWEGDTNPERQQREWEALLWNEQFVRRMVEYMNYEDARGSRVQPASYELRERPNRPPGNPTHVLHADFGHHSAGVVMSPIEEVDFEENFHTRQVLSFVRAEVIDLPFVPETIRAWQERLDAEEKRRNATFKKDVARRDQEAEARYLRFREDFVRAVGLGK